MEMNKPDSTQNKNYFEFYTAKRAEEFRLQYDREHSWKKIQYRIKKRKFRRAAVFSLAASVLIFMTLGIIRMFLISDGSRDALPVLASNLFPEKGGRKAILTLETGENIDLSVQKGIIVNTSNTVAKNTVNECLTYKKPEGDNVVPQMNTLTVARGGEYRLVLSDGTEIWMNAESILRYPTTFTGKSREVFLEGEALFEVAKDTLHPFIVRTKRHSVEVLGTRFNISAYPNNRIYTTLAKGKIKVETVDDSVLLTPEHQAIIEPFGNDIQTKSVQSSLFTSWVDGNYEFRDTPLEDIVIQLGRWYDVDIRFREETLKIKRFTGVIFRNENLSFAVEIIEKISNVRFVREGNRIYIESY